MRLTIGIMLTLLGGVVVVVGLLGALNQLVGMYSAALNDALADGPEAKAVGANMLRWAITGAAGVPFLIIGSVLLKISLFQKVRKMAKGNAAAAQRPTVTASKWEVPRSKPGKPASTPAPAPTQRPTPIQKPTHAQPREKGPVDVPRQDQLGESGGNKSER